MSLAGDGGGLFRVPHRAALAVGHIQVRAQSHSQSRAELSGRSKPRLPSRPPSHSPGQPHPQQLPNLLSFHDIKLHSLPISNTSQKLPGVVSFNSCLVGGKVMRKVRAARPGSLSQLSLHPAPFFVTVYWSPGLKGRARK